MDRYPEEEHITQVDEDKRSVTEAYENLRVELAEDSDDDGGSVSPSASKPPQTVVPYEIGTVNNPPVFGSVNVTNSSEVHFGNKTIFNGPVTIKQVIGENENNGYVKTEDEILNTFRTTVNAQGKEDCASADSRKWITVIALLSTGIIASIITIVVVFVDRRSNDFLQPTQDTDQPTSVEVISDSKLRYVTRTEWIAQPPSEKLDQLNLPVPMVIIAHTATEQCSNQSGCVFLVRTIQTYHIESRKWSDIGYNFLVGGDGSVYIGRGWKQVGAHTKYYNVKSIGIAFIGTFNTVRPPKRQLIAAQQLIDDGLSLGYIAKDYKLYGHRQLVPWLSPGSALFEIIKQWPHWGNDRADMMNGTQAQ